MSNPTPMWRERLMSPLTWHFAGFVVMAVLVIVLAVRFGMDWAATDSNSASILASKRIQLQVLEHTISPLRGLDKRSEQSRQLVDAFYKKRVPPNFSSISSRIGELEVKSEVRLSRVQYSQGKPGADLTEILMDAGISGEYPQIMRFVNGLERDQTFFVIKSMSLTGQQGGTVNLHLQVSTWLRPADAEASGLPSTSASGTEPIAPASGAKEGE
jgi:hypothetical protein